MGLGHGLRPVGRAIVDYQHFELPAGQRLPLQGLKDTFQGAPAVVFRYVAIMIDKSVIIDR
jgi:hypothetical protein